MKIIQFGLPYSPNLGDGIISECLAYGVSQRLPSAEFIAIDLSGRRDFRDITLKNRRLAIRLLKTLPRFLRQRLVLWKLGRMLDGLEPFWRETIKGADLAIIGGGQIFSDTDLNFCLKIDRAAKVSKNAGVKMAIYAVGVSDNWTPLGKSLFSSVFEGNPAFVGMRDAPSLSAWNAQTAGLGPQPEITRDPGLLAADCYGPVQQDDTIGLCITAPEILSYHADGSVAGAGTPRFYPDIIRHLADAGQRVRLFTNGAEEDRIALAELCAAEPVKGLIRTGQVDIPNQPGKPAELARLIASCKSVIAHRLHACIVAYSYGLPIVGLGWDMKVESFFSSANADRFFVGRSGVGGADVAALALTATKEGQDSDMHAKAVEETWAGLGAMLGARD